MSYDNNDDDYDLQIALAESERTAREEAERRQRYYTASPAASGQAEHGTGTLSVRDVTQMFDPLASNGAACYSNRSSVAANAPFRTSVVSPAAEPVTRPIPLPRQGITSRLFGMGSSLLTSLGGATANRSAPKTAQLDQEPKVEPKEPGSQRLLSYKLGLMKSPAGATADSSVHRKTSLDQEPAKLAAVLVQPEEKGSEINRYTDQQKSNNPTEADIFTGVVKNTNEQKRFGFITPTMSLPEGFTQKEVFFHFDKVVGSDVTRGTRVRFRLNTKDKSRPSASVVCVEGMDVPEVDTMSGRGRDRKRDRSRNRNRSSSRKTDDGAIFSNPRDIDISGDGNAHLQNATLGNTENNAKVSMRSRLGTLPFTGRVCTVKDKFGFLQPKDPLPDDYSQKDVIFFLNRLRLANFQLVPGDIMEFNLGTKEKDRPAAINAKLVKCYPRLDGSVNSYLNSTVTLIKKIAEDMEGSESEENDNIVQPKYNLILELVSSSAIITCIGSIVDMSDSTVCLIMELVCGLKEYSSGIGEQYRLFLSSLSETKFLQGVDSRLGQFIQTHFAGHYSQFLDLVKKFLRVLAQVLPQKAGLVARLIKPVISSDKNSTEAFLYDILRQTAKLTLEEVSDMDWNELPLVPSTSELLLEGPLESAVNLSPVKTKGPYASTHEYVDTYFRLLRADCFDAVRTGISDLVQGKLDPRDMNVYHKVSLVGILPTNSEAGVQLALKFTPCKPVQDWSLSSNLMFGNLLCLTGNGTFKDAIWATVGNREEKLLKTKQIIIVELCSEGNSKSDPDCITSLAKSSGSILMVESPTYYRAYQPVLRALQTMQLEEMPFQEELVFVEDNREIPSYITDISTIDGRMIDKGLPNQCPILDFIQHEHFESDTTLDQSQLKAVKRAVCQRVAVVQGPPGTGKTFIGVQLVKLVRSISTRPNSPILVLTYKNHALDEFLKEMVQLYPGEVVRIGGRSNEPELEKYNLSEVRRQKKSLHLFKEIQALQEQQRHVQPQIKEALTKLAHARVFTDKCLLDGLDDVKLAKFLTSCNWFKLNVDKSKVCSLVGKYGSNLKDLLLGEIEETRDGDYFDLWTMLGKACKAWTPSNQVLHQIELVASKLFKPSETASSLAETVVNSVKNPQNKKKSKSEDEEDDGRDLEDVQKERISAILGSRGASKAPDIVWIDQPNSTNKPYLLSSSSDLLSGLSSTFLELFDDPWKLDEYDRAKLIQFLLQNQVKRCEAELKTILHEYQSLCRSREELEDRHKVECIFNKKVIGMTITGASICHRLLSQVKPAIVIVEEAAEVLEPQLIAVLGKWVQHLILIGDHNQLPPSVESYALRRIFNFDVSLMERLINNNYKFASLAKQNRMRPEFAELLKDIYPKLESNMLRVGKNEAPKCMLKSMFFWNHNSLETKERSVQNENEAEMAVQLALFLIEQQYKPENITILGAYLGQVRLMRRKVREAEKQYPQLFSESTQVDATKKKLNGQDNSEGESKKASINVHTIDLYQGDENEVVIVSLVRSNDEGKCGFLKKLNRRCVSQSRAKCGLYFVGNETTLRHVKHWADMIGKMRENGCVDNILPLCCPKHRGSSIFRVNEAKDIPIGKTFCHESCTEVMACRKHYCPKKCQPPHSHVSCKVQVNFIFPTCGHPAERLCYQDEADLKCQKLIQFHHAQCRHLGQRQCHQNESDIKCRQPCPRTLTCKNKHICDGLCGDPCDSTNCKECAKIAKAEAEAREKAEAKAREQAKKDIQKKIEEIKKNLVSGALVKREDLFPKGDTAAEYMGVKDMVEKYIQPGHNWYPTVTRIEKVTNLELERKWLECKMKRVDPRHTALKFHGTKADAVDSIVQDGFRVGSAGMYGAGVYFATDSSKSAQRIYTKGSNQLLLCEVILGKSLTVDRPVNDMTLQKIKLKGYDSVYAQRGTKNSGGVLYDEFVVYDPYQALPRYVIHYTQKLFGTRQAVAMSAMSKPALSFQHHHILPKREIDPNDPLEHEFRMVESQFNRMGKKQYKVLSVDYYVNPTLIRNFDSQQAIFETKYGQGSPESKFILGFHGTDPKNIGAIVLNNFDISKVRKCAYGKGIYFSEFPDVSIGYAAGAQKLLLCKILPGNSYDVGIGWSMKPLNPGYDSHRARKDSQGNGWAIVIDNPDQMLPCYVLTYG